jgi:hypothetical protein
MANFYGAGIGFGGGGVAAGWGFQGDEYGYLAGGTYHIPPSISADHVDKFNMTTDADSVASGNTLDGLHQYCGSGFSETHGYIFGGQNGYPAYVPSDMIQKWNFSTDAGGVDTCNLNATMNCSTGAMNGEEIVITNPYNTTPAGITNFILTLQTATDADTANVATTTQARCEGGPASDTNEGWAYLQGGQVCNATRYTVIDRYQFGTSVNSATVGVISSSRSSWCGCTDGINGYGYLLGGAWPAVTDCDRFAFGSSTNSADVGDLTRSTWNGGPASGSTHGYFQAGWATSDIIQKIQFVATANAANVAVTSRRKDSGGAFHVPSA